MVIPAVMFFNFLCLVKTGLRYLAFFGSFFSFSVFLAAHYRMDLTNQTKAISLNKHIRVKAFQFAFVLWEANNTFFFSSPTFTIA